MPDLFRPHTALLKIFIALAAAHAPALAAGESSADESGYSLLAVPGLVLSTGGKSGAEVSLLAGRYQSVTYSTGRKSSRPAPPIFLGVAGGVRDGGKMTCVEGELVYVDYLFASIGLGREFRGGKSVARQATAAFGVFLSPVFPFARRQWADDGKSETIYGLMFKLPLIITGGEVLRKFMPAP